MKSWLLLGLTVIIVVTLLVNGCGDKSVTPPPASGMTDLEQRIASTPKVNLEAEVAAMWLSDELTAPDTLYREIVDGLKLLRSRYREDIPQIREIGFTHWWGNKSVTVYFDQEARLKHQNGTFEEFDSLNTLFRGEVTRTFTLFDDEWYGVEINYPGVFNLDSLSTYYMELPGVTHANSSYGSIGDWSNLYPYRDLAGRLTFLLREAWGDCPSGCIYSHLWYFKIDGDSTILVGDYEYDYRGPHPVWWDEAFRAIRRYWGYPD